MWGLQVKFGCSNNIIPIIDDLYQYPENKYISVIDMSFLSLWKNPQSQAKFQSKSQTFFHS